VTWHRFDPATFDIGRKIIALDDQTAIGLYDAARSLVDAFRLGRQHGSETAYEGLRRWLREGGAPTELFETANHFPRTLPRLRTALDVLL
jgi:hypothetical protein